MLTEEQLREAQKQIEHENWIFRQEQWGEILGGLDHREEERRKKNDGQSICKAQS